MPANKLSRDLVMEVPLLRDDETVGEAVGRLTATEMPALPVVDGHERLVGIFGEREFMGALFPAYLKELSYAAFVPSSLDDAIEKRAWCRQEPVGDYMNTEHVDVAPGFSDAQVAEIFIHHRVLIIPVADGGRVRGVISRRAFFHRLAARFLG